MFILSPEYLAFRMHLAVHCMCETLRKDILAAKNAKMQAEFDRTVQDGRIAFLREWHKGKVLYSVSSPRSDCFDGG